MAVSLTTPVGGGLIVSLSSASELHGASIPLTIKCPPSTSQVCKQCAVCALRSPKSPHASYFRREQERPEPVKAVTTLPSPLATSISPLSSVSDLLMLENSLYGREFLLDCEFPEGVDEAALTKDLSEEETERSLLESQWELPSKDPELSENVSEPLQASSSRKASRNIVVNKSMSARKRRMQARRNRDLQDQTADANVFRVGLESKGKGDVSEKESSSDFLATFLTEIGKAKLLTREEEIELSRRVKKSVELQNLRARVSEELGREATHSEWAKAQGCSVYSLRRKLREGELARHKLLATNLRLVVSVAKKYIRCGVELSDLVAAGTMGLSKGVEKFDPNRGYKLSTYVHWWIRQAVTRAVADHSRTIRLPANVKNVLLDQLDPRERDIIRLRFGFGRTDGRTMTLDVISQRYGVSRERIRQLETVAVRKLKLLSQGKELHRYCY
ncbi:unnamed protein product [Closterium sp. NIES-54]